MYVVATDGATAKSRSWWLSYTLDTKFSAEALNEALFKLGTFFNINWDCQFTSEAFISVHKAWNVKIS